MNKLQVNSVLKSLSPDVSVLKDLIIRGWTDLQWRLYAMDRVFPAAEVKHDWWSAYLRVVNQSG